MKVDEIKMGKCSKCNKNILNIETDENNMHGIPDYDKYGNPIPKLCGPVIFDTNEMFTQKKKDKNDLTKTFRVV